MRVALAWWLVSTCLVVSTNAHAWIAHEHVRVTETGVQELTVAEHETLSALWRGLGAESASQFCSDAVRATFGADGAPTCVTFTMLPALAADHSCSPSELGTLIDHERWILQVLRVATKTEQDINRASNERQQVDAWNAMHLALERIDLEYTSRALANDAHFLLTRRTADLVTYLRSALVQSQQPNSAAMYALYHLAAIGAARRYASSRDPTARAASARETLLSEAFALHFLQDSFAAGHLVGIWGDKGTKKGTHDFYSSHGLDVFTWNKISYSAHGDAFMKPVDQERTGRAVRDSLVDVLAAAGGAASEPGAVENLPQAFTYDVCRATSVGVALPESGVTRYVAPVWLDTPMPSSPRDQTPPVRQRAEIGPFVSFQSGAAFDAMFGGYQSPEDSPRLTFSLTAALGFGYGLEGVTTNAGDGTFLLNIGLTTQSAQFDNFCSETCIDERAPGSTVPRVPARVGYVARLRMPFWLIPGDLLLAAPILYFASFHDLTKMGILAADGGLIPWQRVFPTAIGDFQIVVGREIAVTMFDMNNDTLFFGYAGVDMNGRVTYNPTHVRSLLFEFPLVQYRPFRAFSGQLGGSITTQFGLGFETPIMVSPRRSDLTAPHIDDTFVMFVRLFFDGRAYL
jgi:hypothetical protein